MRRLMIAAIGAVLLAAPQGLSAQWSTNAPGVPRAAIPRLGGIQKRFELDLSGSRVGTDPADSTRARARIGAGWSWRIGSNVEFGFDMTMFEARWAEINFVQGNPAATDKVLAATVGYGLRFGLKARPLSFVDLDGNGFEAAVGVGYQPRLQPALIFEKIDDSTQIRGFAGSKDKRASEEVHSSLMMMAAGAYKTPRISADLAVVSESADKTVASQLPVFSGLSIRAAARYKLTHGFGIGGAYWGSGAPPWRDRTLQSVGRGERTRGGIILSWGSSPEGSTELMISTPTGSFKESISFYLSKR